MNQLQKELREDVNRLGLCMRACEGIPTKDLLNGVIPKPKDYVPEPVPKGKPKSYCIIAIEDTHVKFHGWRREDLDANGENRTYYEDTNGRIIHFRSEHMVAVIEDEREKNE